MEVANHTNTLSEMSTLGYREIFPDQTTPPQWRDITVNTGASQSTLQDIKLPESAGGFAYNPDPTNGSCTRNRFIYWRVCHDVLEIVEHSLDFNLTNNHVRFKFTDTPLLEGVSIHETSMSVIILVATVSSVHRLAFTHPTRLQKRQETFLSQQETSLPSIFSGTINLQPSSYHVLPQGGASVPLPHIAASWFTNQKEAIFALANSAGNITVVIMHRQGDINPVTTLELRHSSVMQRLWAGILPGIRSGGPGEPCDIAVSLSVVSLNDQLFVFALCRDHKLRAWSCQESQCLLACDVVPEQQLSTKLQHGAQRHVLSQSTSGRSQLLAAYMCFSDRRLFCVLQPFLLDNSLPQVKLLYTVHAPEANLLDFEVTDYNIWALWVNIESETILSCAGLFSDGTPKTSWSVVSLQPPLDREVHVPDGQWDARDAYLQSIFHPNRFSVQTITKAINIFRRSLDTSVVGDNNQPSNVLREEVTSVVENEIQTRVIDQMSEDDYLDLVNECWSRFYSCCVQYHDVGMKPLGIFVDQRTGESIVIRKNMFSAILPRDMLEYLALSPTEELNCEDLVAQKIPSQWTQSQDLPALFSTLRLISVQLSPEANCYINYDLLHLIPPEEIAEPIVNGLIAAARESGQPTFCQDLQDYLNIFGHNMVDAVDFILSQLDVAVGLGNMDWHNDSGDAPITHDLGLLFCSSLGISTLAECVKQVAETRFYICRDLLMLLIFALRLGDEEVVSAADKEKINGNLIPRANNLCRCYYTVQWLADTVSSPVDQNSVESGLKQMEILAISDSTTAPKKAKKQTSQNPTLLELFLRHDGGSELRSQLAMEPSSAELSAESWHNPVQHTVKLILQLVWPESESSVLLKFFIVRCQYLQLQQYARLLQGWCESHQEARTFLLGQSYLNMGETYKALDCFMKAARGISTDPFMANKLIQLANYERQWAQSVYYLKVIQLFEQFYLPDVVITLANTAITESAPDDPNLPTLWIKVFKHHLDFGHYDEAYNVMMANPDTTRRKDCLRQFLVRLCEKKQLKSLVDYSYTDVYDDVVSILESRARAVDISTQNYYELLYSFHITRGNYIKGASMMYEYALRLGNELPGVRGLQKQAKCLLACLNALRLVRPNYAWIVKPVPVDRSKALVLEDDIPGMSPKRSHDGDEPLLAAQTRKVEVFEITDVTREYELVHARLRILKMEPDPSGLMGLPMSADETVAVLVKVGLFDTAITICKSFKLPLKPVFEGLTAKCVKLVHYCGSKDVDDDIVTDVWKWLGENEGIDQSGNTLARATEQAWHLLQSYLETHEESGSSIYHRCIATKLLSYGMDLPCWLLALYKVRNPAELLRLYLEWDKLEEAANLALEYINAVLGKGKEYFGLKTSLHALAPAVWMPYTELDHLLVCLKELASDYRYNKLLRDLEESLDEYSDRLDRVSRDMQDAAAQQRMRAQVCA